MATLVQADGFEERRRLPATQMAAAFVAEGRVDQAARRQAVRAVIDTLAVTVAGGLEPGVRALEASLRLSAEADAVASFWTEAAYRADDAALLIGMASHVLDYDDVSMLSVCHPSAPVLSAALAAAPKPVSGKAVLDALVIGTEVMVRLGQAMGFRHYALGFHATATLGAVGAAAACARLAGLDTRRTAHAISIAASLSSGIRKNFGSMVKSLHVGIAAANGLKAARLAAAGVEGAQEAIEGEGFLYAFSGAETDYWPEDLVFGSPFVIADPGFEQKRYPCCYMLHKTIEATLGLRREHGVSLADVRAMRVDMAIGGTKPLIHPFPKTGLNALFSAPYAVAASLEDGRIDLKSFTDAAVLRPEIQARLRDVAVVESEAQANGARDIGSAPVTVTLSLASGAELAKTVTLSPGSLQDPLTDDDLKSKWVDCLQRARPDLSSSAASALLEEGLGLADAGDIHPWLGRIHAAVVAP